MEYPRSVTFNMSEVRKHQRAWKVNRYSYMLQRMDETGLGFWPVDPHGEDYGRDPDIETEPELWTRKRTEEALRKLR